MAKGAKKSVPSDMESLHQGLRLVSGVMVRRSLEYMGITLPATLSVPEINERVIDLVVKGKLTPEQVRELILDSREHANKRVFLYRADVRALAAWEPPEPRAVVSKMSDAILPQSAGPERLGYILLDGNRIRIGLTELHTAVVVDLDRETFVRVPVQRVIVLEANRGTGDVTLLLDPPEKRHPHQNRRAHYYSYWKDRAAALLQAQLEPTPIVRALGRLEAEKRVKIGYTRMRTAKGRIGLTGIEADDIRDFPEYSQLRGSRIAFEEDEYIWLPQPPVAPNEIGIPARRVKTNISTIAGEIRFMQHAVACEVQYVVGQLRANA